MYTSDPLVITIPEQEFYDQEKEEFFKTKAQTLQLEHSLLSLSKWESKWHKPFLSTVEKTQEETLDYIRCMTITQNVDPSVYRRLSPDNYKAITDHINAPMTATTFSDKDNRKSKEIITSELLYFYMTALNIPMEFEKWHLNKLLVLIKICSIKNAPSKKMSKREILRNNHALNMARRSALGSRG